MDMMSLLVLGVGFVLGLLVLGGLGWLGIVLAFVAWGLGAFVPLQGTGMNYILSFLAGVALYGLYALVLWLLGLVGLAAMLSPLILGLLVVGLMLVGIAMLFQPAPPSAPARR
jgi:hypothetical protein